jgi:hypothetical protein
MKKISFSFICSYALALLLGVNVAFGQVDPRGFPMGGNPFPEFCDQPCDTVTRRFFQIEFTNSYPNDIQLMDFRIPRGTYYGHAVRYASGVFFSVGTGPSGQPYAPYKITVLNSEVEPVPGYWVHYNNSLNRLDTTVISNGQPCTNPHWINFWPRPLPDRGYSCNPFPILLQPNEKVHFLLEAAIEFECLKYADVTRVWQLECPPDDPNCLPKGPIYQGNVPIPLRYCVNDMAITGQAYDDVPD